MWAFSQAQVYGLSCLLFMILGGFVQAKALNLRVLPDSSSGSTLVVVITFICDFLSFS